MNYQGFRSLGIGAAIAAIIATALPADAVTTTPQMRHLVYSFTRGASTTTEVHTSGMASVGNPNGAGGLSDHGSASGMASSSGGTSDRGTITVDVVRQQPDNGLVVNVSEQAVERRSAPTSSTPINSTPNGIGSGSNRTVHPHRCGTLRSLRAPTVS